MSSFDPVHTTRLVVLAIISVILMTVDHRFSYLDPIRSTMNIIVYPIQLVIDLPTSMGSRTSERLLSQARLLEENRMLRVQQTELQVKLQKFASLKRENARLRKLLASAERFNDERILVAELLSVDLDPYRQQVIINKGSLDGVYIGQPLLDATGVMGQVTHVHTMSATAILISDPSHAVPVQVNRNGFRTLVIGTGDSNLLQLPYVPTSGDIEVGDIVVTSGLGGRFPPDYPVAEITRIVLPPGEPFAVVEAKPFARLDRSREVLLVWPEFETASTVPETSQEIATSGE